MAFIRGEDAAARSGDSSPEASIATGGRLKPDSAAKETRQERELLSIGFRRAEHPCPDQTGGHADAPGKVVGRQVCLLKADLQPITGRLHLAFNGPRPAVFVDNWPACCGNCALCNTQQRYSPLGSVSFPTALTRPAATLSRSRERGPNGEGGEPAKTKWLAWTYLPTTGPTEQRTDCG